MGVQKTSYNGSQWWLSEIQARVVSETGIPSDRNHLGKLTLDAFKDVPEKILQIDGATGETETFGSALKRTVQCANAFRKLGLKQNDVIILMAPNHIHLGIPLYAAFCLGIGVAAIDETLRVKELHDLFILNKPKVIFCQSEKVQDIKSALNEVDFSCEIVSFDSGADCKEFSELLHEYGNDVSVDEFKASDFDPEETTAMLIATSGTTGLSKSAEVTHKNLVFGMFYMWSNFDTFPTPTRLSMVFSPLHWYSAIFQFVSCPLLRQTRLQSSLTMTQDHAYYLINKYRPTFAMSSPNTWTTLFKPSDCDKCDFTSFEMIIAGGSAMPPTLLDNIKKATPNTLVMNMYGMSEMSGLGILYDVTVPQAIGRAIPSLKHKLVNPETLEEITEPNVSGELWVKGPSIFKGYYNNPDITAQTLTKDGWLRTGDIMYRDKNMLFYFVDRLKLLLKYRNNQISPVELEALIGKHPGVFSVAVTGIPHPEFGDLPVACVVPHEGSNVSAQEIKDLVKNTLTDSKQLRGGVIFLKELPLTASGKVNRTKLAALTRELKRE